MSVRLSLPEAVRNPVSLLGIVIATAMAWLFLALFLLELFGYLTNPYVGLLVFVTVPVLFVASLLLIPAGAWLSSRRRRAGVPAMEWPVIDLPAIVYADGVRSGVRVDAGQRLDRLRGRLRHRALHGAN